jgi:rhomboid protease GluP
MHIAMNMLALFQVGQLLERRYGSTPFTVLYLLGGLGGAGASYVWQTMGHVAISAGASGAIMGLIGAAAVSAWIVGGDEGNTIRNNMLTWAALTIVMGFFAHADNAAHIGGFVVGAALGLVIEKTRWIGRWRGIGVAGLLFIALVGGAFALTWKKPIYLVQHEDGLYLEYKR